MTCVHVDVITEDIILCDLDNSMLFAGDCCDIKTALCKAYERDD